MMTIASTWGSLCEAVASAPPPAEAIARARLCLADHLHAAMHGARSDTGALLRRYAQEGAPASPGALGAEARALYTGAISAVHEIDDVHQDTSLHPGSCVIPAALAAAAQGGASGLRLLTAIALGYEIAVRLSMAAGHRHYHYFHATATCGTVGAAVAAASIYGHDAEQTAHAIGIAVTSASGLWEGINHEAVGIKHLHPGLAAERGVRAAKLARLGLRGAQRAIEGDKGFLAALAQSGSHAPGETPGRDVVAAILSAGLGERWIILRNIFKRYPFCLGCFEPLEGLRHLLALPSLHREAIEAIVIELWPSTAWMVGQSDPSDEFAAKFSAPYALALVLAGHDPERVPLPARLLNDGEVRRWMARIRVQPNPDFGRRRARVTAIKRDGTQETADRPFRNLDDAEVWARFARACQQYLGARGEALERLVGECAEAHDVSELAALVLEALQK